MHATKGGWSGQAFAVVSSNDSGGRKSRIRRSKEERKAMAESFIKKKKLLDALHAYSVETSAEWMTLLKALVACSFKVSSVKKAYGNDSCDTTQNYVVAQKSNNGSFPSLNLAHKEVGGSFYTVREIVREIIQENRVLAPPKGSIYENGHSEFLDLHPLGSLSVEPPFNLAEAERVDMEAHLVPDGYQLMGDESIASSSIQFHETMPVYLANEQILEGVTEAAENKEVSDGACATNHCQDKSTEEVSNAEQWLQPHFEVFKNNKVSNGVAMLELNQHFNKQEVPSYKNDKTVDETFDVGKRNHEEEVLLKDLNVEKRGGKDVEGLEAVTSHMKSDVVVEKFPLRPITKMDGESSKLQREAHRLEDNSIGNDTVIHVKSSIDLANGKDEKPHMKSDVVVEKFPLRPITKMDGESSKLQREAHRLEDNSIGNDAVIHVKSSIDHANGKDEKTHHEFEEFNGSYRDEKVVQNLQNLSGKHSEHYVASELSPLDISGHELKASSSHGSLNSQDPISGGRSPGYQDNNNLNKRSNSTLDRINLETWEGSANRTERNPFLALVKAFVTAFSKLWS